MTNSSVLTAASAANLPVKAAGYYSRAVKLETPEDGHLWFEYAAVQLLAGDREGHRRSCARLQELSTGRSPNVRPYHVARAWTLGPIAGRDLAPVSALSARELRRCGTQFWSLTEQGALLCRAGRPAEAVPLLERSLRERTGCRIRHVTDRWVGFDRAGPTPRCSTGRSSCYPYIGGSGVA